MLKLNLKNSTRGRLLGVVFVVPTLAFIILFGIVPIISSIRYSFTNWDGMARAEFTGLKNYVDAFKDNVVRKAILNTFILSFSVVALTMSIGFILANFLSEMKGRLAEAGKVVLFMPHILSLSAVAVLFSFIYSSTDLGLINKFTSLFGAEPFPWLGSIYTAMPAVILAHVWKGYGFDMLIYYAGIQSIPTDLLEAADIDGATPWQKIWKVKIPCLKPVTQLLVVLGFVRAMLTFTMIMFLTPDGGPSKSTEVVATWFYKQSFSYWEFGYGAALAIILSLLVFLVTTVMRKIFREEV